MLLLGSSPLLYFLFEERDPGGAAHFLSNGFVAGGLFCKASLVALYTLRYLLRAGDVRQEYSPFGRTGNSLSALVSRP
jgi:hypothetical protein